MIRHIVLLLTAIAAPLAGATIRKGAPGEVGLAPDRLSRISTAVNHHLDEGDVRGAVTAVARRGRTVFLEASGVREPESEQAMTPDAIFLLTSMTQPVVSVAVLMLMEEGKLHLDDPVSLFIPELAHLRVAVTQPPVGLAYGDAPPFSLVPAHRPITIQDLLTHTAGLGSGPISIGEAERIAPAVPDQLLADRIPKFANVPLEFQPGEAWAYSPSAGFDTLLRIVEIISGKTADRFLDERIFQPLGMTDAALWTPAMRNPRLVPLRGWTSQGSSPPGSRDPGPPHLPGASIVSTAEDYLQFGQMLLNGGELNGVRLLGPRTVDLLRSAFVKEFDSPIDGRKPGRAFGLGVQVIRDPVAAGDRVGAGTFGWDGALGSIATHFWVDPTEKIVGVVLLQGKGVALFRDVENAVMQAIVD
jgi:CubicO group peptidase (beta-lactamase class C family)